MKTKTYRRIFLLTLLLPLVSLLAYWGAEFLPNGPLPYALSFLVILPNFAGMSLVYAFFPASITDPSDPFHMITGIVVNWVILAATLTLIWFVVSLKRQ